MSTHNETPEETSVTGAPAATQARSDKTKAVEDIDVVSLEIADDDFGGDPYNRTGQFVVIKMPE